MQKFYISIYKQRPDFRLVIAFLWHDGQNVDTEGDSYNPASRDWTELYIKNREQPDEIVNISPHRSSPLILIVESNLEYLAARVAYFLAVVTDGRVATDQNGEFAPSEILLSRIGDFDVDAALQRVAKSPFSSPTRDNPYPNLETKPFWKKLFKF